MSTIGNGINGIVPGQTSSKSKAAHGKTADTSQKNAFASAVASLQGKAGDGESGRKGGRISIAETSRSQIQIEQTATTTRKAGERDLAVLAEALKETSVSSSAQAETLLDGKAVSHPAGNGPTLPRAHVDDRTANTSVSQKNDHLKTKQDTGATQASPIADTRDAADELLIALGNVKDGKNTGLPEGAKHIKDAADIKDRKDAKQDGEAASAKSDVGNLLEMLAAPAAIPQAIVNGAAVQMVASGVMQDVKGQPGEKGSAKAEIALAAKVDGKATANADAALLADMPDAGEVPQSDTDQLFRLIRADGKGRDLDMSISGTGERTSVRDASQTAAGKAETVTVLDSRRYIGLAPTSNASAVTTAIAQDPNWAASLSSTGGLSHSEAAATGKVVNTLKIQMKPIDLGTVTATLRLHGDALVVSLQVETGEAYRQLSDDQDAIVKALRGQGFAVDQVSVQLSSIDRSSGTPQQGDGQASQQQQQSSSQPQAREGGNGRQSGNGDGTRTFAGEGTSHDGNTSENASGLAGGQSVRSGGVYL
ncbi:flagellar hook-length control protein FliK [Shinella sp. M31]|uniref:flagellar hook-length control protein FliK n=1 Tax=Shinella sp. M31 TaxID=3368615 RepID=UPI003BA38798